MPPSDRTDAVRAAIAIVNDPELDESVVDLGFISDVAVDNDRVSVRFRLPTFWCSPNFAWIMAEDMRAALLRLDWVGEADVRLVDHLGAAKINAGVNAGASFSETFGAEAGGSLATLRETFRHKAYLGRTSRLIEALKREGWADSAILALSVGDLRRWLPAPASPSGINCHPRESGDPVTTDIPQVPSDSSHSMPAFAGMTGSVLAGGEESRLSSLVARYLELRGVYGGSAAPSDPAFRTLAGEDIAVSALPAFLRDIRMTRRGVEANGEMCRILLAGRNSGPVPA